jgi:type I restriction enzyme, S subunit
LRSKSSLQLGEVVDEIVVGWVGPMTKEYVDEGIPFLRSLNVKPYKISFENMKFISKDFHEKIKKSALHPGDVVVVRTGNSGIASIVPDEIPVANCSDLVIIRPGKKTDANFLVSYLNSKSGIDNINGRLVGSVQNHFNIGAAKSLEIPDILIGTQKKISDILTTLENKTKILENQNKILEQITQVIFKSWFVDFNEQTEFIDSELGKIPKGWTVGKVHDVIQIFDGKRIPLSTRERMTKKGEFPYYGATSIIDYVDDYIFDGVYFLLGEDGSVIQDNGTPFVQYVDGKIWVNNHAHVIQGKDLFSTEFMFLFFQKLNINSWITGAVQLKLNQKNLLSIPVIIPVDNILMKFDEIIKPFFSEILKNEKSIIFLKKMRDSLLPKLMSGELVN